MTLASMTGFSRATGGQGLHKWTWEIRSFNSRGLDVKCRLPSGHEQLEASVREKTAKLFARGSIQVALQVSTEAGTNQLSVNREFLERITALVKELQAEIETAPPTPEGILGLRGVLELKDIEESETESAKRFAAMSRDFDVALSQLQQARSEEGAELEKVLRTALDEIDELTKKATSFAAEQKGLLRERLKEQVKSLLETSPGLPEERLAQEVALLATKADVSEELDRLTAHLSAAHGLLDQASPVGRRLDFLMQEFNRETNTICSKSTYVDLTNVGLELKAVIDRVREQVQNIE